MRYQFSTTTSNAGEPAQNPRRFCTTMLLLCCAVTGCASSATPTTATSSSTLPTTINPERLGAVGIGVRNLESSGEFYQQVLGLQLLRTYELGYLEELVLGYPASANANAAVLVLMHWPNDTNRQYGGGEMKLVFYVDDPKAVIEQIRQRGGSIEREATPHPALNGRLVGLARDPDHYLIELLER